MSDLQLSLLVIGVVVVAAVYLYNWWQERRLRRRLQEAFGEERDDALMKAQATPAPRAEPHIRLEPQMQPAVAGDADSDPDPDPERVTMPAAQMQHAMPDEPTAVAVVPDVPWFDETLDYVAEIRAPSPIGAAVVAELLSKIAASGKPCRAAGYSEETGEWQELARTGAGRHTRLRLALQLVNRAGPVSAAQLAMFCDAVKACAERAGAVASSAPFWISFQRRERCW